jgi:hypothetical protein
VISRTRSVSLIKHKLTPIFCTILLGSFAYAHASSTILGSYGTTSPNPGVANTALTYDSADSTVNNGSSSTYDISPGSTWHAALSNSSYISFSPDTGPTSNLVAPNGDYIYNTTFTLAAASAAEIATMSILADDTVSVFLNKQLILSSAGPMGAGNSYARCSDVGPNCLTPLTFTFAGLQAGLNQLEFDVKQVNGANEGLDFFASIPDPPGTVPEPLSLALFGTGLLGLLGISRRYVNSTN